MYLIPNDATHVLVTRIEFSEGEPEETPIQFGSFEECDAAAKLVNAIAYSGDRAPTAAFATVYLLTPFCEKCRQRHEAGDACR